MSVIHKTLIAFQEMPVSLEEPVNGMSSQQPFIHSKETRMKTVADKVAGYVPLYQRGEM